MVSDHPFLVASHCFFCAFPPETFWNSDWLLMPPFSQYTGSWKGFMAVFFDKIGRQSGRFFGIHWWVVL